ncbi:hypothetical protein HMI56_003234, partial [Coelomomyces lativittatus]
MASSSSNSSSSSSHLIHVLVRKASGEKVPVLVDTSILIEELKTLIYAVTFIPENEQTLIYGGKILEETQRVLFY